MSHHKGFIPVVRPGGRGIVPLPPPSWRARPAASAGIHGYKTVAAQPRRVPDEDASLSDFVDDDGAEADDDETGPSADDAVADVAEAGVGADDAGVDVDDPATTAAPDESATEPAVPTATWNPDGACERCGATAPRRWREGDALVCAECRDW